MIGRTAQLGFYEVLAFEEQVSVPQEDIEETKAELEEDLRQDDAFEAGETKVLFEESPSPAGDGTYVAGYVVSEQPAITGGALDSANMGRDQAGKIEVTMEFTREGAGQFADLSGSIAENALAAGQPGAGRLAIVLDDDVISAPTVQESIVGGNVSISNDASPTGLPEEEARSWRSCSRPGRCR